MKKGGTDKWFYIFKYNLVYVKVDKKRILENVQ